jgi:hypothetical protein
MNEDQIEHKLRNAPQPPPPSGLREKLEQQIELPSTPTPSSPSSLPYRDWRGRVIPWAALLVAAMIIGVQSHNVAQLRRDNETLRGVSSADPSARGAAQDADRIPLLLVEIERLRRQNVELHQLRGEVSRLREQVLQIDPLQSQIQQLHAALAAAHTSRPAPTPPQPQLPQNTEEELSIRCINHLKNIGLAARIYESDHDDTFPPDFLSISNELSTPQILICPSDSQRVPADSWNHFIAPVHATYEFLNPGGSSAEPTVVLARCPIHGHLALSDGSVHNPHNLPPGANLQVRNGKQELILPAVAPTDPAYYERIMMERYGIVPGQLTAPPADSPYE